MFKNKQSLELFTKPTNELRKGDSDYTFILKNLNEKKLEEFIKIPECYDNFGKKGKNTYYFCLCKDDPYYPICIHCKNTCHKDHEISIGIKGYFQCRCYTDNHCITEEENIEYGKKKNNSNNCLVNEFHNLTIYKEVTNKICSICQEICMKEKIERLKEENNSENEENINDILDVNFKNEKNSNNRKLIEDFNFMCNCDKYHSELNIVTAKMEEFKQIFKNINIHFLNFNYNILYKSDTLNKVFIKYLKENILIHIEDKKDQIDIPKENFFTNSIIKTLFETINRIKNSNKLKYLHVKNIFEGELKPEKLLEILNDPPNIIKTLTENTNYLTYLDSKNSFYSILFETFIKSHYVNFNNFFNFKNILNLNFFQRVIYLHRSEHFYNLTFQKIENSNYFTIREKPFKDFGEKFENWKFFVSNFSKKLTQTLELIIHLEISADISLISIMNRVTPICKIFKFLFKYNLIENERKDEYLKMIDELMNKITYYFKNFKVELDSYLSEANEDLYKFNDNDLEDKFKNSYILDNKKQFQEFSSIHQRIDFLSPIIKTIFFHIIKNNDEKILNSLNLKYSKSILEEFSFQNNELLKNISKIFFGCIFIFNNTCFESIPSEKNRKNILKLDLYIKKILEIQIGNNDFNLKSLNSLIYRYNLNLDKYFVNYKSNYNDKKNNNIKVANEKIDKNDYKINKYLDIYFDLFDIKENENILKNISDKQCSILLNDLNKHNVNLGFLNKQYYQYEKNYSTYIDEINKFFESFKDFVTLKLGFNDSLVMEDFTKDQLKEKLTTNSEKTETYQNYKDFKFIIGFSDFIKNINEFMNIYSKTLKFSNELKDVENLKPSNITFILKFFCFISYNNVENLPYILSINQEVLVNFSSGHQDLLFEFINIISKEINKYDNIDNYYFVTDCISFMMKNIKLEQLNFEEFKIFTNLIKIFRKMFVKCDSQNSEIINLLEIIQEKIFIIKKNNYFKNFIELIFIQAKNTKNSEAKIYKSFFKNYFAILNIIYEKDLQFYNYLENDDFCLFAEKFPSKEKIINDNIENGLNNNPLLEKILKPDNINIGIRKEIEKFFLNQKLKSDIKFSNTDQKISEFIKTRIENETNFTECFTNEYDRKDLKNICEFLKISIKNFYENTNFQDLNNGNELKEFKEFKEIKDSRDTKLNLVDKKFNADDKDLNEMNINYIQSNKELLFESNQTKIDKESPNTIRGHQEELNELNEFKDFQEFKEFKEYDEFKEFNKYLESKKFIINKNPNETKEEKEFRDLTEFKKFKETKEKKESKDFKDFKKFKENGEFHKLLKIFKYLDVSIINPLYKLVNLYLVVKKKLVGEDFYFIYEIIYYFHILLLDIYKKFEEFDIQKEKIFEITKKLDFKIFLVYNEKEKLLKNLELIKTHEKIKYFYLDELVNIFKSSLITIKQINPINEYYLKTKMNRYKVIENAHFDCFGEISKNEHLIKEFKDFNEKIESVLSENVKKVINSSYEYVSALSSCFGKKFALINSIYEFFNENIDYRSVLLEYIFNKFCNTLTDANKEDFTKTHYKYTFNFLYYYLGNDLENVLPSDKYFYNLIHKQFVEPKNLKIQNFYILFYLRNVLYIDPIPFQNSLYSDLFYDNNGIEIYTINLFDNDIEKEKFNNLYKKYYGTSMIYDFYNKIELHDKEFGSFIDSGMFLNRFQNIFKILIKYFIYGNLNLEISKIFEKSSLNNLCVKNLTFDFSISSIFIIQNLCENHCKNIQNILYYLHFGKNDHDLFDENNTNSVKHYRENNIYNSFVDIILLMIQKIISNLYFDKDSKLIFKSNYFRYNQNLINLYRKLTDLIKELMEGTDEININYYFKIETDKKLKYKRYLPLNQNFNYLKNKEFISFLIITKDLMKNTEDHNEKNLCIIKKKNFEIINNIFKNFSISAEHLVILEEILDIRTIMEKITFNVKRIILKFQYNIVYEHPEFNLLADRMFYKNLIPEDLYSEYLKKDLDYDNYFKFCTELFYYINNLENLSKEVKKLMNFNNSKIESNFKEKFEISIETNKINQDLICNFNFLEKKLELFFKNSLFHDEIKKERKNGTIVKQLVNEIKNPLENKNSNNFITENEGINQFDAFENEIFLKSDLIFDFIYCQEFFDKIIRSVEFIVDENGDMKLKRMFYVTPAKCFLIDAEYKNEYFREKADRKDVNTKINFLLDSIDMFESEMIYKEEIKKNKSNLITDLLNLNYKNIDLASLTMSIVIIGILILSLNEDNIEKIDCYPNSSDDFCKNLNLSSSELYKIKYSILILGLIQISFNFFFLCIYLFTKYNLSFTIALKTIIKKKYINLATKVNENFKVNQYLIIEKLNFLQKLDLYLFQTFLFNEDIVFINFNILIGIISILRFKTSFMFSLQLFTLARFFTTIKSFMKAIRTRWNQLLYTVLFLILIVYSFSALSHYLLQNEFKEIDVEKGKYKKDKLLSGKENTCDSLIKCLIFFFNQGIRTGGGIGEIIDLKKWDAENIGIFFARWFLDMLFFMVIILLLLNMINGVIVSTFSSIRENTDKNDEDIENLCFICSIKKTEFEKRRIDFNEHKKYEHQIKDYINYLIYLKLKLNKDLDSNEVFIKESIMKRNINIFPIYRSKTLGEEAINPEKIVD